MISDLETLALYGHQCCTTCGKNKLISRFSDYGNQLTPVCNSCRSTRIPSKRTKENRRLIDEARSVPCMDCRQRFPIVCMDFDHLPHLGKSFNLGGSVAIRPTHEIISEIARCEVVCSNCHRVRTHLNRPHKRGYGEDRVTVLYPPKYKIGTKRTKVLKPVVIDSPPRRPKPSRPNRELAAIKARIAVLMS